MILDELKTAMDSPLTAGSLRRIFLLLTRLHFSNPAHYGGLREVLKDLIWTPDDKTSQMDVELLGVFDPKKTTQRPAAYVGFKGFKFGKGGVGNFAGENEEGSAQYLAHQTDTTLVIRCIAMTDDMAAAMADSVCAYFLGISILLYRQMHPHLRLFDILGISDAVEVEQAPERAFQVDLTCAVNFNYILTINLESHRIKKVEVDFTPE